MDIKHPQLPGDSAHLLSRLKSCGPHSLTTIRQAVVWLRDTLATDVPYIQVPFPRGGNNNALSLLEAEGCFP
jgi:hypothetical protein